MRWQAFCLLTLVPNISFAQAVEEPAPRSDVEEELPTDSDKMTPAGPSRSNPDKIGTQAAQSIEASMQQIAKTYEESQKPSVKDPDASTVPEIKMLGHGGLYALGLSIGFGGILLGPIGKSQEEELKQKNVGMAAMPYVAIAPWSWGIAPATRYYCAAKGVLGDSSAAQVVADEYAISEYRYKKWRDSNGEEKISKKKAIEELKEKASVDKSVWNPGVQGSCVPQMFAIYGGFPLKYTAMFEFTKEGQKDDDAVQRQVVPKISFGVAFVPSPYISALAGFTLVDIVRAADDDNGITALRDQAWMWNIGIGGNLDIFKGLLKL